MGIDGPEVQIGLNGVLAAPVQTPGESDVLVKGFDERAVSPAQRESGRAGREEELWVRSKARNLRSGARGENAAHRPRGVGVEGADETDMVVRTDLEGMKRVQETARPIHRPFLLRDVGVVEVFVQETTARMPEHGLSQSGGQCGQHMITIREVCRTRARDRAVD